MSPGLIVDYRDFGDSRIEFGWNKFGTLGRLFTRSRTREEINSNLFASCSVSRFACRTGRSIPGDSFGICSVLVSVVFGAPE